MNFQRNGINTAIIVNPKTTTNVLHPEILVFLRFIKLELMILVTGGTGLLGSHLLFELASSGKKIRAIRRNGHGTEMVEKIFSYYSPGYRELFNRIDWFEADLMDFGAIEDAMEGIAEIYHCGAIVSFYPSDKKAMLKVNIEGTANLVNMALEKKVTRFCYVSSVATLGRNDQDGLTDEETYWKPSKKNTVYSISKYGAEREVWRGMEEGLNALIVNPSVILGPGFWGDGNSGLFSLVWNGLKYYTEGINGFVDVRDVAKAMTGLMDQEKFGGRYVLSSENLSYRQVFEYMARYLDKPAPTVHVTPFLSRLGWRMEAVRSFLLRSKPAVTRDMASTSTQVYRYSNEKVKNTIGFTFRTVEESVKDTAEIFLKDHRQ